MTRKRGDLITFMFLLGLVCGITAGVMAVALMR